jgi:putative PIN family toxin of toxin-antitoxin system
MYGRISPIPGLVQHLSRRAVDDSLKRQLHDDGAGGPIELRILSHRRRYHMHWRVRLVLDTNVVVAAMRSPSGASAAILTSARASRVTLLANVALALEYEATCRLAEHQVAASFSARQVGVFIDAVIAMLVPVETHYIWRPQLRDPGDELVLEAAVNGQAGAIVTFNTRDFGVVPSRFRIALLTPAEAIRRIKT